MQKTDRLNTQNYSIWSVKMHNLLVMKGLWSTIKNPRPEPSDSNKAELIKFDDKDERAVSFIMLSIDESHYNVVQGLSTAREIWDCLKDLFQAKTETRLAALAKQITTVEKSTEETVVEYFARSQALHRDLLDIDEDAMSERTLVAIVLNGLPSQFNVAVEVLRSTKEKLAFKTALEPLVNAEQHMRDQGSTSSSSQSSALLSKTTWRKQKEKVFCRYCKKAGHDISECRTLKKKNEETKRRMKNIAGQEIKFIARYFKLSISESCSLTVVT